ncbi:MAG: hypothetical protein JNK87_42990 [Bryobacterales bacterium]|nr:hypothetical protein [Bryobacterales bacterium]
MRRSIVRLCFLLGALVSAASAARPVQMRLLVLTASGTEPSLAAIRFFLDRTGTPYDVIVAGKGERLPALERDGTGLYQGVLLATGNLGMCDPDCRSALTESEWERLDTYTATYGVRSVSYFTFPEARYGMEYRASTFASLDAPRQLTFTRAAQDVLPDLNTANPLAVGGASIYAARAIAAPGEKTEPLLSYPDGVAAVVHTKTDGREYLALNFDQSPYLFHSLALQYELLRWVTKGVFLGTPRVTLTPQVDDLFLPNFLFTKDNEACSPDLPAVVLTTTFATACPSFRMTGADLATLHQWQEGIMRRPQTRHFRLTLAFNGFGIRPPGEDDLFAEALHSADAFFWVNHTFSHRSLSCYAAADASGACRPASFEESLTEIQTNADLANHAGLFYDRTSIVTPGISGLDNPAFLAALAADGVRYLIGDMSRPEGVPAVPNTTMPSGNDKVLLVPRRPTNIFYNANTPHTSVPGSETDEYNHFFGPEGTIRIGGPGGPPYNGNVQTYEQIIDKESDALLAGMLGFELYPFMYHQSNLYAYDGRHSLLTDSIDAALAKFEKLLKLPVQSLPQSEVGRRMEEQRTWMAWKDQGSAVLRPGESVTLQYPAGMIVPVTGVCATACNYYGADAQSRIPVAAGQPLTLPIR